MNESQPTQTSSISPSKKMRPLVLITLFWCGITAVFVGFAINTFYKCIDAQNRFETTTGQVLESRIDSHYSNGKNSGYQYTPVIEYSYSVNGRKHQASKYGYGFSSSSEHGWAKGIVSRYPRGAEITVYYDPDSPTTAVLNPEIPPVMYGLILFLQPFLMVGVGLLAYTLSTPKRIAQLKEFLQSPMQTPWKIPSWGTLKPDMGGTLAIRRQTNPWLAGGVVYAVVCLLTTLLGALYLGVVKGSMEAINPQMVLGVIGIALLLGLAGVFRARTLFRSLLEIEKDFQRIRLTTKTRKEEFHFADIAQWTIQKVLAKTNNGNKTNKTVMAPLLSIVTAKGQCVPIHLFGGDEEGDLISQKVAQELANLTGKPVESLDPQPLPTPPSGLKEMFAYAKELQALAKKYQDVS